MKSRSSKAQYWWYLAIFCSYLYGLWGVSRKYRELPGYNIDMGGGIDTDVILGGLYLSPDFADTLKWWTGSWVAGDKMVYFRPLTSLVWWIEWKLFGSDGLLGFMIVSWMLFGLTTIVAFRFFRRLFDLPTVGLAIALWVSSSLDYLTLPSPIWAPWHWKNDPESWTSLCIFACLGCLLNFWESKNKLWVLGAVGCMALAICFKELGYVTFFMAGGLWCLLRYRKQSPEWWPLAVLFLASLVFFAYRTSVLGRTMPANSNGAWLQRAANNLIGGRAVATISLGEYIPLAISCFLCALLCLRKRQYWPAGILGLIVVTCVWINDSKAEFPYDSALKIMAMYPSMKCALLVDTVLTLIIFFFWGSYLARRDPVRTYALGWIFLAYLPMLTAPVWQHSLYLPSMGWGLWFAVPLLSFWNAGVARWKSGEASESPACF